MPSIKQQFFFTIYLLYLTHMLALTQLLGCFSQVSFNGTGGKKRSIVIVYTNIPSIK